MSDNDRLDVQQIYSDKAWLENNISGMLAEFMKDRWSAFRLVGIDTEVDHSVMEGGVKVSIRVELR